MTVGPAENAPLTVVKTSWLTLTPARAPWNTTYRLTPFGPDVEPTATLPTPMFGSASRAACTWAAVALVLRADVARPLNESV